MKYVLVLSNSTIPDCILLSNNNLALQSCSMFFLLFRLTLSSVVSMNPKPPLHLMKMRRTKKKRRRVMMSRVSQSTGLLSCRTPWVELKGLCSAIVFTFFVVFDDSAVFIEIPLPSQVSDLISEPDFDLLEKLIAMRTSYKNKGSVWGRFLLASAMSIFLFRVAVSIPDYHHHLAHDSLDRQTWVRILRERLHHWEGGISLRVILRDWASLGYWKCLFSYSLPINIHFVSFSMPFVIR